MTISEVVRKELHVFADEYKEAIGAVAYMKVIDSSGKRGLSWEKLKYSVTRTYYTKIGVVCGSSCY